MAEKTLLVFAHSDEATAFAAAGVPHLLTGVGKVNAALGLADAILAAGPREVDRVVVLGTAGLVGEGLHSIANTQDRQFAFQNVILDVGSIFCINRLRSSGEDYAERFRCNRLTLARIPRKEFTIDVHIADAATNQLGKLRTKVKNHNSIAHHTSLCLKFIGKFDSAIIHRTNGNKRMDGNPQL